MSSRPLIAPWRLRLRFGFRNGRLTAAWGLLILLLWFALALFAPWIAPYDPIAQNTEFSLLAPSLAHPFGTDNYGRDILTMTTKNEPQTTAMAIVDSEKSGDGEGVHSITNSENISASASTSVTNLSTKDEAMVMVGEQEHELDPALVARTVRKLDFCLIPVMLFGCMSLLSSPIPCRRNP